MSDTIHISVEGGSLFVRSPFYLKEICKELPGRKWNAERKVWAIPATPHAARTAKMAFGGKAVLCQKTQALVDEAERLMESNRALKRTDLPEPPSAKTPCWRHQRESFWFAEGKRTSMLALGMGCGKSKVACDLVNHWKAERILIVCPLSVVPVWQEQFERHSSEPWVFIFRENETIARFAKRVKMLTTQKATGEFRTAIVLNYDAAWREPFIDLATSIGWDALILDESHRCKAPSGKAARGMAAIGKQAGRILALTGTPMPHSPMDIYAQFRILEPSIFGTNYHSFEQRYAIKGGFEGRQVLGYRNQDDLREKFFSIAYQVDRSVLDLPEALHIERHFDLTGEARKIYDKLEADFVAQVKDGEIVASNAMVKLLRLQQITGGTVAVETEDATRKDRVSDDKREILLDIFADLPHGEPIVVFCRFVSDLAAVHEAAKECGRESLELSGSQNDLAAWKAGEAPILAAQIQSGSVGVDMTRAAYVVFYSVGFSLGDYEQALARSHRPGQDRPVTYYHLIANDTVDGKVYKALQSRKDAVAEILKEVL